MEVINFVTSNSLTQVSVSGCYQNAAGDYSVRLFPSGKASYALDSSPVLTCHAASTDVLHPPLWCKEMGLDCIVLDGDKNSDLDPNSFNVTHSFAESNCTWITHLEIKSFSANESGTYRCYVAGTDAKGNVSVKILEDPPFTGWL